MVRILFVCLGNICRSVTAEEVMRKKLKDCGLEKQIEVDSAGLIDYHEGELADARMREHAEHRGYKLLHRSRPIRLDDFSQFDLILGMDHDNVRCLRSLATNETQKRKVGYLASYATEHACDVIPDPYYGGSKGFELVLDLVEDAVDGLMAKLTQ